MSLFVVICFAVSAILAALAALNVPSSRFSLMAAALAFLSLGFLLQSLVGVTG